MVPIFYVDEYLHEHQRNTPRYEHQRNTPRHEHQRNTPRACLNNGMSRTRHLKRKLSSHKPGQHVI